MKACPCGSRGGNPVLDPCIRKDDNKHVYLFKLKVLALSCVFIFCFEGSAGPCEEPFGSRTRTPAVTTPEQYSVRSSVWKISAQGGMGTGFFITANKFITNFHVIYDSSKVEDITLSQEGNAKTLKIKGILAISALHDLALLETTGSVDHYLSIRRKPLQEQEDVFLTGYPGGKLTDMRKTSDGIMFSKDTTSFFVNHHSSLHGASGSPIVNAKKQVVGVFHSSLSNLIYSVNLNDLQVFVQRGLRNKSRNNPRQVVKREVQNLRNLAKRKNTHAQVRLGLMYYRGAGVTQNFEKAAHWLRQAAEQGHADAQFNLGMMYALGEGVTQNFERAAHWLKQAAEQGHALAQFNLGVMYVKSQGVTKNFETAFYWLKQAAEQGHADAQLKLGAIYIQGYGVTKNYEKASDWLKQAAMQGHAPAQYLLGGMYYHGEGVTQNFERAAHWLKQAAEQGHFEAKAMLEAMPDNM